MGSDYRVRIALKNESSGFGIVRNPDEFEISIDTFFL